MKFRPAVPDNKKYWQVFEDDKQIEDFLLGRNEFESSDPDSKSDEDCLNEQPPKEEEPSRPVEINMLINKLKTHTKEYEDTENEDIEVLSAKDKNIPRGLAPLEDLFDFNDVAKKPIVEYTESEVEECNIGTEDQPKMIKLARSLLSDIKKKYIDLFKYFVDVFAWSYQDLKAYDTEIIQHKIPLREKQKPFKKKLRQINPIQLPLVKKEIKKMYEEGIIVPVRFSDWVSNLVAVRKKTGEIRLCIDFKNLNRASLKDNYPLPKM